MPSSYQPLFATRDGERTGFLSSCGLSSRRRWLILALVGLSAIILWAFSGSDLRRYNDFLPTGEVRESSQVVGPAEVTLLIASMKADNTSWLEDYRPEWKKRIYVTDDKSAALTVPMNKGREAMVYLTYIIDHYETLSPVTIFHHATRYQWHNDDPLYDGQRMLDRLQIEYILAQGYVNLRCVWTLGCPAEIHPVKDKVDQHAPDDDDTGSYYAKAFSELFPDSPIPDAVGVSCCAQFAASDKIIRARPLADYIRIRQWLIDTDLRDHVSGRILEYSWHIIFGRESVFCPSVERCYCQLYGLCNLTCSEGTCPSQYTLPPYSTLPNGWPEIGWKGEVRNITEMRAKQALDYTPATHLATHRAYQ